MMDDLRLSDADVARYISMSGSEQYAMRARAMRAARVRRSHAFRNTFQAITKRMTSLRKELGNLISELKRRHDPVGHLLAAAAGEGKQIGQRRSRVAGQA